MYKTVRWKDPGRRMRKLLRQQGSCLPVHGRFPWVIGTAAVLEREKPGDLAARGTGEPPNHPALLRSIVTCRRPRSPSLKGRPKHPGRTTKHAARQQGSDRAAPWPGRVPQDAPVTRTMTGLRVPATPEVRTDHEHASAVDDERRRFRRTGHRAAPGGSRQ